MKLHCGHCKQVTDAPDVGEPHVVNLPASSVIVVEHPEQSVCESCGTLIAPQIVRVQLMLAGFPVAPKKEKSLLVIPGRT